jgi:hypothetical protein
MEISGKAAPAQALEKCVYVTDALGLTVEVAREVTLPRPHRPGRAGLQHPVPPAEDSLKEPVHYSWFWKWVVLQESGELLQRQGAVS